MPAKRKIDPPIPPKLSDADARDLLLRHSEGWHPWELAARFKLSTKTVDSILRGTSYKHIPGDRVPRKTGFMTLEKAALAKSLQAKGWDVLRIAKRLSVGKTSVKRALSGTAHWSRLWAKRTRTNRLMKRKAEAQCAEK